MLQGMLPDPHRSHAIMGNVPAPSPEHTCVCFSKYKVLKKYYCVHLVLGTLLGFPRVYCVLCLLHVHGWFRFFGLG